MHTSASALFTSLFCKFFVPVCELKHPAKMMQCNIYSCCLLLGDEGKKNWKPLLGFLIFISLPCRFYDTCCTHTNEATSFVFQSYCTTAITTIPRESKNVEKCNKVVEEVTLIINLIEFIKKQWRISALSYTEQNLALIKFKHCNEIQWENVFKKTILSNIKMTFSNFEQSERTLSNIKWDLMFLNSIKQHWATVGNLT
jgi:hypothetical protein